jgi:hypothetical protein
MLRWNWPASSAPRFNEHEVRCRRQRLQSRSAHGLTDHFARLDDLRLRVGEKRLVVVARDCCGHTRLVHRVVAEAIGCDLGKPFRRADHVAEHSTARIALTRLTVFLNAEDQFDFERLDPEWRGVLSAIHDVGPFSLRGRINYYGSSENYNAGLVQEKRSTRDGRRGRPVSHQRDVHARGRWHERVRRVSGEG